ncbi:MAG: SIS domain-containing protein [Oscillospiraceae bacterium]|nr:SIS domain-containing protein [Oscillospiraceae bacterium]
MKDSTKKIIEALFLEYDDLKDGNLGRDIISAYHIISKCYAAKGKTLICGNGGSASDCEHIVGEFMKGFKLRRPLASPIPGLPGLQAPLRSISLASQTSIITAVANDIGADYIFAQQVLGYADKGDVLIALSTSGKAANVQNAVLAASALECGTIAITGKNGGKLADICDLAIKLPADETYKVQELTLPVYHALCAAVENEFFGE